jgi:transcriptional regulator with XRE-family HTH domain
MDTAAPIVTGSDLRAIRSELGLTQKDMAKVLGYAQKIRISEYERTTNPRPIPRHIQEAVARMWVTGQVPANGKSVRVWDRGG